MASLITHVSSHGQIVIPKNIRKKLKLNKHSLLSVECIRGRIVLRPVALKPAKKN